MMLPNMVFIRNIWFNPLFHRSVTWVPWCVKSTGYPMFVGSFVQVNTEKTTKLRVNDLVWEEATYDRWIPLTKVKSRGKCSMSWRHHELYTLFRLCCVMLWLGTRLFYLNFWSHIKMIQLSALYYNVHWLKKTIQLYPAFRGLPLKRTKQFSDHAICVFSQTQYLPA